MVRLHQHCPCSKLNLLTENPKMVVKGERSEMAKTLYGVRFGSKSDHTLLLKCTLTLKYMLKYNKFSWKSFAEHTQICLKYDSRGHCDPYPSRNWSRKMGWLRSKDVLWAQEETAWQQLTRCRLFFLKSDMLQTCVYVWHWLVLHLSCICHFMSEHASINRTEPAVCAWRRLGLIDVFALLSSAGYTTEGNEEISAHTFLGKNLLLKIVWLIWLTEWLCMSCSQSSSAVLNNTCTTLLPDLWPLIQAPAPVSNSLIFSWMYVGNDAQLES